MTKNNKTKIPRGKWAFVTKKEIRKIAQAEGEKVCEVSN